MATAEASIAHLKRLAPQARPFRACVATLLGRRGVFVLVLVLMLVVLPAWLVLVVYDVNFLKDRPQAASSVTSNLRASIAKPSTTSLLPQDTQLDIDTSAIDRLLALGDQVVIEEDGFVYPESVFAMDWSTQVSRHDILHMGALQRGCMAHCESVIPWQFGRLDTKEQWTDLLVNRTMDEAKLLAALKQCPPVDIYIPTGLRGYGYCEDATAYTKYLRARMIPHWVLEIELFDKEANRTFTYHELCPRTPMLFFNYYWDGLRDDAKWPNSKPVYLMPNIEMYELEAHHYWQVDVILCKTALCTQYINKWYAQVGNPRMTEVISTRFTTSDMATNALVAAGDESADAGWSERVKDFETPVFVHTAGGSMHKGSRQVLDCWLSCPDLPQLDFYIGEGN